MFGRYCPRGHLNHIFIYSTPEETGLCCSLWKLLLVCTIEKTSLQKKTSRPHRVLLPTIISFGGALVIHLWDNICLSHSNKGNQSTELRHAASLIRNKKGEKKKTRHIQHLFALTFISAFPFAHYSKRRNISVLLIKSQPFVSSGRREHYLSAFLRVSAA